MASNKNFNIVDPNKEGNGLQPLEDLNIDVQLTVKTRGRKNQEPRTIKFIEGTIKNNDGTKSLSTNFTEIGTNFGDNNDLETLGIKSIDIDFNASYTPMVKMTFIDLRGDSIITKGDESKYNFFFQLPYPVFELKIKGYYGKTVTYCLNMTKYGSKFNSDSGHFEINCDFIGYTYAFLSDMLMGYMKAITNTDRGRDIYKNLTAKHGTNIPTLTEFIVTANKLNTDLEKLKENEEYILLSKTIGSLSKLNDIELYIRNTLYDGISSLGELTKVTQNINFGSKHFLQIFSTSTDKTPTNLSKNHSRFFSKLRDKVGNYNTSAGTKFSLNVDKFNIDITNDLNTYKSKIVVDRNVTVNNGNVSSSADYVSVANSLLKNKNISKVQIYEYTSAIKEIKSVKTELEKQKEFLEAKVADLTSNVVNDRFGDFKLTIGNIMLMLTAHAETLVRSINDVTEDINISSREDVLKKAAIDNKLTDTYDNGSVIYPFPNYAKDKLKFSWIGDLDSSLPEVIYVENLLDAMIRVDRTENQLIGGAGSTTSFYPINVFDNYKTKSNPYFLLNDTSEVRDSLLTMILRASSYFLTSLNTNTDAVFSKKEVDMVARVEARNLFNSLIFDDKGQNKIYEYLSSLGTNATSFYGNVKEQITKKDFIVGSDLGTTFSNGLFKFEGGKYIYQFLTDETNNKQILPFTDDLRSRQIAKNDFLTDDTNFNNLLTKTAINSFEIITSEDVEPFNFPELPEATTSGSTTVITEDTYFGKIKSKDKIKFNFANTINSNITIYGGVENNFKYRTFKEVVIESQGYNISNYITYYYNVDDFGTLDVPKYVLYNISLFNPHATGLVIARTENDYDNSAYSSSKIPNTIAYDKNIIDNDGENTFSIFTDYDETFFGKKIAVGSLPEGRIPITIDNVYLGNVSSETSIQYTSGKVTKPITLFGSEFYNKQINDKAKALLFLNSFPFKLGEDLDFLIEQQLNRQSAIVEVPKMLIVLIGGMLWRSQQIIDPIVYYKDASGNASIDETENHMASINLDTNGKPVKLVYPKLDEFIVVEQKNPTSLKENPIPYLYHLSFLNKKDENSNLLSYAKLPKSITTMSQGLKDKFITLFEDWYNNFNTGWPVIKEAWELTKVNTSSTWEDNANKVAGGSLSGKGYKIVSKIVSDENNTYNTGNTNMVTIPSLGSGNDSNPILKPVVNYLNSTYYIYNSTPKVWDVDKTVQKANNSTIDETLFKSYVENFYTELVKLKVDKTNEEEKINEQTKNLNSKELSNLKLNIYRNIKAIHDKWLGDGNLPNNSACGVSENLFDTFKIIDKHYNDISDEIYVNPKEFVNNVIGGSNTSLSSFLSKFLASMNFDFIALPNFLDLSDNTEIESSMFNTFNYNTEAKSIGPSFICMYVGDTSKYLDLDKSNGNPRDDGANVMLDKDFGDSKLDLPGAAFLVKYGQQNQSIFKDLELNQQEFTETDEGLIATDALSNPNSIKNGTFINQSLFNIYSTRSYNCGVTCMGNAMIQPMTYFQLENVPMFRGAYLIKNVSHSIKANTMETKFTGSRITKYKVPILDKNTVFMNLLGSIKSMTNDNTSLTSELERSDISVSFGNDEPSGAKDGLVQTIDSFNVPNSTDSIDSNDNNGIIYV